MNINVDANEIIGESLSTALFACSQKIGDSEEFIRFSKMTTDFQRMEFALKQDFVHEIVGGAVSSGELTYQGKDAEKSKQFKDEGNKFFSKKSYMSAVEEYNKAVMFAPFQEADNALSIALANRSAALLHLRKFELCLADCELAIEEGYPEPSRYKLADRRGKALMQSKRPEEACKAFEEALVLLKASSLDEKGMDIWSKTLNKQIAYCDKIIPEPVKTPSSKEPKLGSAVHEVYPDMHENTEMAWSSKEDCGRIIKATKKFRVGSIVAQDSGYVSALHERSWLSHCYHCFANVRAGIPCYKTSVLMFCSKKCREIAWKNYHQIEYKFIDLLRYKWCGKIGKLAIRLALTTGYEKLIEYTKEAKKNARDEMCCQKLKERPKDFGVVDVDYEMQKGMEPSGKYSQGYHAVYNMQVNMNKRLGGGLYDFANYAVFLTKILQRMDFFKSVPGITYDTTHSEELALVAASLLRNLEVIQCNGFPVLELQHKSDFDNPNPLELGTGVYTTAGLFNHNCDPNADMNFYGDKVYIRAIRNIKPGEEICVDYGVVYYKDVRNGRRGKLQFRFCFECQCAACKGKWPLWRELETSVPKFSCEECGRKMPMGKKKLIDNTSLRCESKKCNTLNNLQERMNLLQVQHDYFAGAMNNAMAHRYEEALPVLEDYMQALQKYVLPPWRDLVSCQAAIKQCYRFLANVKEY